MTRMTWLKMSSALMLYGRDRAITPGLSTATASINSTYKEARLKKNKTNPEYEAAARELREAIRVGEEMVRQAGLSATTQMAALTKHLNTGEARIEAVRHHTLHIGIGTAFMEHIAPQVDIMQRDLVSIGASEHEARILTGLFLAKVFIGIDKSLREHDNK